MAQNSFSGEEIAKELGWNETATVTNYKNIKTKLHPLVWKLARDYSFANGTKNGSANRKLAIANWVQLFLIHVVKRCAGVVIAWIDEMREFNTNDQKIE